MGNDYATMVLIKDLKANILSCNNALRFRNVDGAIRALDSVIAVGDEIRQYHATSRLYEPIQGRIAELQDAIGSIVFEEIINKMNLRER